MAENNEAESNKVEQNKLYHYTSVNGFEGIIKNDSIIMTRSEFLNDPNDCRFFIELMKRYLNSCDEEALNEKFKSEKECVRARVDPIYAICSPIEYIQYVRKLIGLYVMSLSNEHDSMAMWNYYGNAGVELEFSKSELANSFKNTFISEKEFLIEANVIYVDSKIEDKEISKKEVPNFTELNFSNKDNKADEEDKGSEDDKDKDTLYKKKDLGTFFDVYLRRYRYSLYNVIKDKKIDIDTDKDKIFEAVFEEMTDKKRPLWQRDIFLYMLVLSALIKVDSYKYENEHRIVYFECNIGSDKKKEEEYYPKSVDSKRFICPYITMKYDKKKWTNVGKSLLNPALKKITLSPAARNLPIGEDIYEDALRRFIRSNHFSDKIEIKYSRHDIRW